MFFAWIFKYSDENLFYPLTEKQDGIFKLVISSSLKIWKENEKKKWNLRNWIFYCRSEDNWIEIKYSNSRRSNQKFYKMNIQEYITISSPKIGIA